MKKISSLCLLLMLFTSIAIAQKNKANEKYILFDYKAAIPLYEKYLSEYSNDEEAWHKLAECYTSTNQVKEGIGAYKQLVSINKANASDYFTLVQLLQIAQQIDDAKMYAKTYASLEPGNKANTLNESLHNYDKYMATTDKFVIANKTIQYNYSVRSPIPYKDKWIVTAESKSNQKSNWMGYYTDLFITDNSFQSLEKFATNLMTKLDECSPTFSSDGKTMYYTTVNENSAKVENIQTRNMHILSSTFVNNKWQKPVELSFHANTYSCQHATINDAGTLMVFSSNKTDGKGGFDLYYSTIEGNTWSEPINIATLNTFGSEVFPVFNGNHLIFSSNGLPGLGGLDLYKSKYLGNGSFESPENLNAPLNSSYDDFSLVTLDDFNTGYLSSNRGGKPQEDDILYFAKKGVTTIASIPTLKAGNKGLKISVKDKYTNMVLPYVLVSVKDNKGDVIQQGLSDENGLVVIDEIECGDYKIQGILNDVTTSLAKVTSSDCNRKEPYIEKEILHNDPRFTLRGIVKDATTSKPLDGVKVTLKNETNGITKIITTKSDGKFFFQLEQKSNFSVMGEKPKWLSSEQAEVSTEGLNRSTELFVDLSLKMHSPTLHSAIRLKNIFYDLNKSDIKPTSERELNSLIKLLNEFPDMKIELSSHTDCRNTNEYNQALSQRRSEGAIAFLLSKGISKERMIAKGYGESKLLNRCADGVNCSEEEHQENRRTEFTILQCPSCPK